MKRLDRLALAAAVGYEVYSFVDEDAQEWVVAVRPALDYGNGLEPEHVIFEKKVTAFNWRSARFAQARLAVLSDVRLQMQRSD